MYYNPNSIRSYKIVQKLSPKQAAHGVAQSPYPIYRHRKACLSKQPPWRAAGDPRLARSRSRVRAMGPVGVLRALFFYTLPSFLLREKFFRTFPTKPVVRLGLKLAFVKVFLILCLFLKNDPNYANFFEDDTHFEYKCPASFLWDRLGWDLYVPVAISCHIYSAIRKRARAWCICTGHMHFEWRIMPSSHTWCEKSLCAQGLDVF